MPPRCVTLVKTGGWFCSPSNRGCPYINEAKSTEFHSTHEHQIKQPRKWNFYCSRSECPHTTVFSCYNSQRSNQRAPSLGGGVRGTVGQLLLWHQTLWHYLVEDWRLHKRWWLPLQRCWETASGGGGDSWEIISREYHRGCKDWDHRCAGYCRDGWCASAVYVQISRWWSREEQFQRICNNTREQFWKWKLAIQCLCFHAMTVKQCNTMRYVLFMSAQRHNLMWLQAYYGAMCMNI